MRNDVTMTDYSDLIEKVKTKIIPRNIKNKKRRDEITGDFYNVQSIQVSQLAKYSLTDEELSFVISFLAQENIEVTGTIPDFCWDNDEGNYVYLRTYKNQPLPKALKQEEILSLYERKKKLENINADTTDLERKKATEDMIKDIREKLILGNMRLARWCAVNYYLGLRGKGERISNDEVNQMAYETLIKTVDHYDFTRGIAFSSYAIPYIKRRLYNDFRRCKYKNSIVKVSDYMGLELNKVTKAIDLLKQSGKIDDKDIEKFTIEDINSIVESLDDSSLDIPKIQKDLNLLYVINNPSSLDMITRDEIDRTEVFSSPVEDIVVDTIMKREDVIKSMETLTDVERFVLLREYGFVDDEIKTRPQIVEDLNRSGLQKNRRNSTDSSKFTYENVVYAECKGLRKMRHPERRKRLQDYA